MVLRLNIIPRNKYANFLPINAVSGSSFILIKFQNYLTKLAFFIDNSKSQIRKKDIINKFLF